MIVLRLAGQMDTGRSAFREAHVVAVAYTAFSGIWVARRSVAIHTSMKQLVVSLVLADNQITRSIIVPNLVHMMHLYPYRDRPPESFLCDQNVLQDVSLASCSRMPFHKNPHVPVMALQPSSLVARTAPKMMALDKTYRLPSYMSQPSASHGGNRCRLPAAALT